MSEEQTLGEMIEDDNSVPKIETFETVALEERKKKKGKKEITTSLPSAKLQVLDDVMASIEKAYGKGAIRRLGEPLHDTYPSHSTGILELDIALGVGGFPEGRIVEIYGAESSGKTTITLSTIAEVQKKGGVCAFIDAEHALDPKWAKKLGVRVEDLLVAQPDNGEEGLEICESLVRSNSIDLIVIDSVASLVPKAEIEGDMGDSHMGLQARLMSQALRKLTGAIAKSKTTVIFINQERMKIGVMFGSPKTTTGGNALKFYASQRLEIARIETLKEKEEAIGNRVRAKVVKNKMASPFTQAEFTLYFKEGFVKEDALVDLAVNHDLLAKAGSWYSYQGEKIGQGKSSVIDWLKQNPDICQKLESQIRELNF